jgi:hypothetical protein
MRKIPGTGIFMLIIMVGVLLTNCTLLRPVPTNKPHILLTTQNSPSPVPSEKSSEQQLSTKMYFIALEDNGKSGPPIGCGDSLIAVDIQVKDARTALQSLLENHSQWYGQSGLYNALYQSVLKIERFELKDGKTEVDLSGNLLLGGVCDNPRFENQLKATIRQSSTDNSPVSIRINGTPLEELLSQK